jgi:hypothetical protein
MHESGGGKQSFHVYGIDRDGVIVSRKLCRAKLMKAIAELAPEVIAMEACASAHYWGRQFLAAGHRIRPINPHFVKPFVKGSKNDAVDAEAIYEAASRPTMRFVPVKSIAQQDLQSLHRARESVVCTRTALINHMRGLLGEYGVILPQGAWRFVGQAPGACHKAPSASWDKRPAPFQMPNYRISRGRSSAICLTSSTAISIADLRSSMHASWPYAGQMKHAAGSPNCRASAR